MDQYRKQGMELALEMFGRTIEQDPEFARAWAAAAQCHAFLFVNADRRIVHIEQALESASRALELDPNLAEAHTARAIALSAEGRLAEADREFEVAHRLEPRSFDNAYFHARHCFSAGRPESAVELYEQAARLDPNDFQAPLLVAQSLDDLGRPDEAAAARRRGVALAEERVRWMPDDIRALYMGANGLVGLGRVQTGLEWARRARALDPGDPMLLYNLACIHALAGSVDTALEHLSDAIECGFTYRDWLLHDGDLKVLRDEPRFRELAEQLERARASVGAPSP